MAGTSDARSAIVRASPYHKWWPNYYNYFSASLEWRGARNEWRGGQERPVDKAGRRLGGGYADGARLAFFESSYGSVRESVPSGSSQ